MFNLKENMSYNPVVHIQVKHFEGICYSMAEEGVQYAIKELQKMPEKNWDQVYRRLVDIKNEIGTQRHNAFENGKQTC